MGSGKKSMKSDMGIMGNKGKGKGMGMKGQGTGLEGTGMGLGMGTEGTKGLGLDLASEGSSEGTKGTGLGLGLEGVERSMGSGEMGAMGVGGIKGLSQPTLRAISCDQLTFALQRECYSIPVVHVQEDAWPVKITPTLQMPGYSRDVVKFTGIDSREELRFDDPDWTERSE
jgi:hypothetical protein